jgi:hypothetical protein
MGEPTAQAGDDPRGAGEDNGAVHDDAEVVRDCRDRRPVSTHTTIMSRELSRAQASRTAPEGTTRAYNWLPLIGYGRAFRRGRPAAT